MCVTDRQMHMTKICLSDITICQYISVATATIIRVLYKNINSIKTFAQNV